MSRFDNIKEFRKSKGMNQSEFWGRSASRNPAEVAMSQSATSRAGQEAARDCLRHREHAQEGACRAWHQGRRIVQTTPGASARPARFIMSIAA